MEAITNIEKFFVVLDDCSELMKEALEITYLEALAEAGENIFQGKVLQEVDEAVKKQLQKQIDSVTYELQREEVRKAFGLAVIKGMKEATQAHHALTPDAVALFITYLANKLLKNKQQVSVMDIATGTSNLLTAVINGMEATVSSYGFEVDETLLKLSYVVANLQQLEVAFFHQDALKPIATPEVDIIITDLPVGYYPNEEVAQSYVLKSAKGRSFVHHLLLEQAITKVRQGGFIVCVVPNFLFESEEAPQLNHYIKQNANIIGLLQLPQTMFKSQQYGKSIFVLQKKGQGVVAPKQALLVELPSFSRKEALASMVQQIDKWFASEFSQYADGTS